MTNKREVLITGGAGFIGSHIQDRCLAEGDNVTVVDNLISGHEEYLSDSTHFYKIDICDEESLEKIFQKVKPTFVIHTAAQNQVPASMKNPRFDLEVNVRGMFNVLDASRKNGTKKFVYTNTGGALYGEQPDSILPMSEDVKILKPASFYNISKLTGEYYMRLFGNLYNMVWVSLRLANVYGPRQDAHGEAGIIAIFINKMLNGEVPIINGDGEHTRDYVYVQDVVDAVTLGMKRSSSDYFNISSNNETSNLEIFETVKLAVGSQQNAIFGPERVGDVRRNVLDNGKALKTLGWRPKTNIIQGIQHTIEYQRGAAK